LKLTLSFALYSLGRFREYGCIHCQRIFWLGTYHLHSHYQNLGVEPIFLSKTFLLLHWGCYTSGIDLLLFF
jgi:hypothetical protein